MISSFIRDHESAKRVLLGELVLMLCLLIVAVFNTLNARVIVDACPPPPFGLFKLQIHFCVFMLWITKM